MEFHFNSLFLNHQMLICVQTIIFIFIFIYKFETTKSSLIISRCPQRQVLIINSIMEKAKVVWLTLCVVIVACNCDIQTGIIDVNRQMGGLQTINDFTNVLCYTHIFVREFGKQPKIATSLTEFATDSDNSLQLQVRIRKMQLLPTQAKFMIFARKEVSVWSKLVFSFMASDRDDFFAAIAYLNVEDLSGCGHITRQDFYIKLDRLFKKPYIAAFLNGFDIEGKRDQYGQSYLQVSVEVQQKKEDQFTLSVSRVSNTQVYTVSVSYVIMQPVIDQQGYSLQVAVKMDIIQSLPAESPFIFSKPHQANLNHAKFLIGLGKFRFSTKERKSIKSLAVQVDENSISIGSFDSANLELVQFTHMIIRETRSCRLGEIIVRDPTTRILTCQRCQHQAFKIPNKAIDQCVCIDGFYEIGDRCYQQPDQGKWSEPDKSFICNNGFTMMKDTQKNTFRCLKTPLNKLLDTATGEWKCINDFYQQDGECMRIPQHGYFDQHLKQVRCQDPYQFVEGQCIRAQQNQYFSASLKKFVCKESYYRVNKLCVPPFPNSYYHETKKSFLCKEGHYLSQPSVCDKIPQFMRYDQELKRLCCQDEYYDIKDAGCQRKPQQMQYNAQLKIFECQRNHHLSKGKCRTALPLEEWSEELKQFICVSGSYKIKENCLQPKPNTRYSHLLQTFVCVEGFYDINGDCLQPPPNMIYAEAGKRFMCRKGYQEIFDQDKYTCLEIPPHKQWCKQTKQFKCSQNYYEIGDGRCEQPRPNEMYNQLTRQFVCERNHIRIKQVCSPLPANSFYSPEKETFVCAQGFYHKDEYSCAQCKPNCLECDSSEACKTCKSGYELKSVYGGQPKCQQVCGDGFRFQYECDDGNTDNGDGCSSLCKIQANWICDGGSPYTKDKCDRVKVPSHTDSSQPVEIKMTGMSHLYGKMILNVKVTYMPLELQNKYAQLSSLFRVLTNSKVALKTSTMYIDSAQNTFVILYDFNKFEPIPEYVTRVEITPEMKERYFAGRDIKSLFIKVNPAYMARKDKNSSENVLV